jgi:hypothetical protein
VPLSGGAENMSEVLVRMGKTAEVGPASAGVQAHAR